MIGSWVQSGSVQTIVLCESSIFWAPADWAPCVREGSLVCILHQMREASLDNQPTFFKIFIFQIFAHWKEIRELRILSYWSWNTGLARAFCSLTGSGSFLMYSATVVKKGGNYFDEKLWRWCSAKLIDKNRAPNLFRIGTNASAPFMVRGSERGLGDSPRKGRKTEHLKIGQRHSVTRNHFVSWICHLFKIYIPVKTWRTTVGALLTRAKPMKQIPTSSLCPVMKLVCRASREPLMG